MLIKRLSNDLTLKLKPNSTINGTDSGTLELTASLSLILLLSHL